MTKKWTGPGSGPLWVAVGIQLEKTGLVSVSSLSLAENR